MAVLEPLGQGPDHGFPLFDGFLLGEGGKKGEHKFGTFFDGIQVIRFKKYPHRRIKVLEPTDQRDTVHQVPGKAGDAFCYDQVIFSLFTGGDHVVKRRAVFQRDPGDPLIGVNMPQTPVGPLACQLAVVGLLKLKGRQLRVVVGRNAAIRAYTEKPVPESGFRFGGNKAFLPGIVIRGTDGFRHRVSPPPVAGEAVGSFSTVRKQAYRPGLFPLRST